MGVSDNFAYTVLILCEDFINFMLLSFLSSNFKLNFNLDSYCNIITSQTETDMCKIHYMLYMQTFFNTSPNQGLNIF